ncbi:hypothetical protein Hanom_Chr06g00549061 [Helianthus anomalus]
MITGITLHIFQTKIIYYGVRRFRDLKTGCECVWATLNTGLGLWALGPSPLQ